MDLACLFPSSPDKELTSLDVNRGWAAVLRVVH